MKNCRFGWGSASVVSVCVLLAAGAASAQSSAEINAGIQFNFTSPGARSLGRGGAFIADASDATAAYANPAGLVNIPAREISLEARSWRFTNEFTDRGHVFGPPTGIGEDTIEGLRTGRATNDASHLAFASAVFPFAGWTIAAYRHELARFEASAVTRGVFFDLVDEESGQSSLYRHYPAVSALRLDIAGLGVAAAVRGRGEGWTRRMSFGAGVRHYESEIDSVTRRYETREFFFEPAYDRLNNVQTQRGEGRSWGVNAGFLFDVNPRFSVGASYRQGFSFPVSVTYEDGDGARAPKTAQFNVPSFYGGGFSFRPTPVWSISMDVNYITYSDTTRNFVLLFEDEPRYFVPDGTEVRVGTELILTRNRIPWLPAPVSLSAGAWRDPDHSIRVSDPTDSQSVLFRPTEADHHVSAGVGVLIGTRLQMHVAADRSRRQTIFAASMMARF